MLWKRKTGFGLLPKLLLGIFIPIVFVFFIMGSLVFFTWNIGPLQVTGIKGIGSGSLKELSAISMKESKSALDKLGEQIIREKAIDVAMQMEIFIKSHPRFKKEDLMKDPWLKSIAVQKVGETGYTAVHDNKAINYFHANPQIVGTNLHHLSEKLPAFWEILKASLSGPASGYYDWKDADGKIRPKYMYLTPVKDTNLIVASTTYIEEFSMPAKTMEAKMKQIERRYLEQYERKFRIFYVIMLLGLMVLLGVIYFYSRSVIRPIHSLSQIADQISMGDLDAPIPRAEGEVGLLSESIGRMQVNLKAAIERLQKRRDSR